MRRRRKIFLCILHPMSIVINICCFYEHEGNVKLTRRAQNTTLTASRITSCSKSDNEFQMLRMWVARNKGEIGDSVTFTNYYHHFEDYMADMEYRL